jgi:pectin methylesterase-like acyl-CoA thioesterase
MKRFISLFLCLVLLLPVIPAGIVFAADNTILTVDAAATANGTTVFNKIQDAINAVPANNTGTTPYEIIIKNGTYIENVALNKNWVTITGESRNGVIVKSPLPDALAINDGGYTIFGRSATPFDASSTQASYNYSIITMTVSSSDCTIQNLTIKLDDYYIDLGPNPALKTEAGAQRNIFKFCTIAGGQDTLYENGRNYYYQCAISGHVDFMYGSGSSVFDSCDIRSIYWERYYNLSEIKGIISYGLSESDRTARGITADDIALWTATDSLRSKYPNIFSGMNFKTMSPVTDFSRVLSSDELKALSDEELSLRNIARNSNNNPNGWKTIDDITVSDSKRIKKVNSGYLTACSTGQTGLGFLYINCNMIGDPGLAAGSYLLGRPWRPYSQTTYVNCKMGPHISKTGWSNWGNVANESTARYEEYGTMNLDGTAYDLSQRYTWAKILTDVEVLSRNPYNYLKGTDGWDPTNQGTYYTELNNITNGLSINSIQYVSGNLELPTTDASGATIQWLSSNANLISTAGVVNRPAFNAQNENVTLTAAVKKNGRGVIKDFALTVLKASDPNVTDPDNATCLDAYNALQTNVIPTLNLLAIKNDLVLPSTGASGTTFEWKSFNPSITDAGKVTRPAGTASDSTGKLQVTIRKNGAAIAYEFDTKVIKYLLPTAGMYKAEDFVGVGVGGATGTQSYNADTNQFSITGAGSGFTKDLVSNDQFYFNGVLMSGDFTISSKITTPASSSPSIGLTIRDSLDPLSFHVTQGFTATKGRIMYRYSGKASGSTNAMVINAATVNPTVYQQLTKKGNVITSTISATPITPETTASTPNTVISSITASGLGVDAYNNQKEIYAGFVTTGGLNATYEDVKIVTGTGVVVFDSNSQAPIAPKNVVATPGDKSATITWDAITNATSYTVKQSVSTTSSALTVVDSAVITPIQNGKVQAQINNLINDTTYNYAVTASNTNGESAPSAIVTVTPNVVDTAPPAITMTSAAPASQVYGDSLSLSGSVDEASTVTIKQNGNLIKLDGDKTSLSLSKDGTFCNTLTLTEGINNIEISAVDARGNKASKSYIVNYTKIRPADFVGYDIGAPAITGSSSFDDDTNLFKLTAAAIGINKNAPGPDQIYLKAVKMTGDYTISAKINCLNFDSYFKGGMALTVRESLDPASYHFTQSEGNNTGRKMFRYSKGDGTVTSNGANFSLPTNGSAYVRLTKKGNDIVSVISLNPIDEKPVQVTGVTSVNTATALDLGLDANGNPKELYVGFVLYSNIVDHAISASFEDVKIVMADGTVAFDANEGTPIAPKNAVTKAYDKSATISWDALSTATSYTVKQSTSPEGPFNTVNATFSSENGKVKALINGLENEKTYYYVVTASNDSGESIPTKVISVTPSATVLIPQVLTITSADPATEVFSALLPISGYVDKASTLTIKLNGNLIKLNENNTSLYLNKNETFSNTIVLTQGINNIEVKTVDAYDNTVTKNYQVTYSNKVANINFYDTEDNIVTKLVSGKDIVVKAEVENYIDTTKDSVLVVGLYDAQNNLVQFVYTAETLSNGESEVFYAGFRLPDDVSGYTVKAYVWSNVNNIHPISEVVVLK